MYRGDILYTMDTVRSSVSELVSMHESGSFSEAEFYTLMVSEALSAIIFGDDDARELAGIYFTDEFFDAAMAETDSSIDVAAIDSFVAALLA